jgi:hypothetical protein
LKKINEVFDGCLDEMMVEFKNGNEENKANNQKRLDRLKERLVYI